MTKWSALQFPDEEGNCDWHSNLIGKQWSNTEERLLGDWGISSEGIACHSRAMFDILEDGGLESLVNIKKDLNLTDKTCKEFCSLVYKHYGKVINYFMVKEFGEIWRDTLRVNGVEVKTPFLDFVKQYKEGKHEIQRTETSNRNKRVFDTLELTL